MNQFRGDIRQWIRALRRQYGSKIPESLETGQRQGCSRHYGGLSQLGSLHISVANRGTCGTSGVPYIYTYHSLCGKDYKLSICENHGGL